MARAVGLWDQFHFVTYYNNSLIGFALYYFRAINIAQRHITTINFEILVQQKHEKVLRIVSLFLNADHSLRNVITLLFY